MAGNLVARSIHDLTAAAWFGGSLMGAIGLNRRRRSSQGPNGANPLVEQRLGQMGSLPNRGLCRPPRLRPSYRLGEQRPDHKTRRRRSEHDLQNRSHCGRSRSHAVRGPRREKVDKLSEEGAEGATEPRAGASDELKSAQTQLKALQWAIPAFAAWVIILGAKHGEMQRPKNILQGLR